MNTMISISPKLEKDLDQLIRKNMKGETFFSPLNFSPSYQQDNLSRLKLRGYRENYFNPFFPDYTNQLSNKLPLKTDVNNDGKILN